MCHFKVKHSGARGIEFSAGVSFTLLCVDIAALLGRWSDCGVVHAAILWSDSVIFIALGVCDERERSLSAQVWTSESICEHAQAVSSNIINTCRFGFGSGSAHHQLSHFSPSNVTDKGYFKGYFLGCSAQMYLILDSCQIMRSYRWSAWRRGHGDRFFSFFVHWYCKIIIIKHLKNITNEQLRSRTEDVWKKGTAHLMSDHHINPTHDLHTWNGALKEQFRISLKGRALNAWCGQAVCWGAAPGKRCVQTAIN